MDLFFSRVNLFCLPLSPPRSALSMVVGYRKRDWPPLLPVRGGAFKMAAPARQLYPLVRVTVLLTPFPSQLRALPTYPWLRQKRAMRAQIYAHPKNPKVFPREDTLFVLPPHSDPTPSSQRKATAPSPDGSAGAVPVTRGSMPFPKPRFK